jgi:transketolase
MLNAEYGSDLVDHHTYVLASDGDLMEGISHEAIALAGHLKLNKLIVLFDDNSISIDGPLVLADSVDQVKRFEAAGWEATRIDGHDPGAIAAAIEAAKAAERPSLIACRTTIGFGAPTKAGTEKAHGSPLGADEIAARRAKRSAGRIRPSKCPPTCARSGARPARAASPRARPGRGGSPRSAPSSTPSSSGACAARSRNASSRRRCKT